MAYIQPNSKVYLLEGVPFDSDYHHTGHFNSELQQYNYFYAHRKISYGEYNNLTYQRKDKNKIRLSVLADNIYSVNYMMFQNTNYGNKWFYAFVDKVEYINDATSEITYTIDKMNTWFFNFDLGECFVEREHTLTDGIGDNIIPEGIDVGELQYSPLRYYPEDAILSPYIYGNNTTPIIVIASTLALDQLTFNADMTDITSPRIDTLGSLSGNDRMVDGCGFYRCFINKPYSASVSDVFNYVKALQLINQKGWIDGIKNVFLVPQGLIKYSDESANNGIFLRVYTKDNISTSVSKPTISTSVSGYTPKNKKMLTSPFYQLFVSNNDNQNKSYAFEYFQGSASCGFSTSFLISDTPCFSMFPSNYKGIPVNTMERISLASPPQITFPYSPFETWLARNQQSLQLEYQSAQTKGLLSALGSLVAVIAAPSTAGASLAAIGALTGAVATGTQMQSIQTKVAEASIQPNELGGTSNGSKNVFIRDRYRFDFYNAYPHISRYKTIDNFFNMYGYAIKDVKKPNIKDIDGYSTTRPCWNYIKTTGCMIHPLPDAPFISADDESELTKIFDNGITFWKVNNSGSPTATFDDSYVGDYSRDNSPS